ncbi:putative phosphatidylinositol 4-phosphate 5-kinase 11 [Silene latifolia]|uniref:putative phosphatidylinositol 4-phosphate 5-kinase 11 n=1 Tax=Silene latifolia TaxID=37657 RepID=UPI003D784B2A
MALLRKQLSTNLKSSRTTNIHYSKQSKLPPGAITDFVWKDYCTTVFRNIQELGGVKYEEYMLSVCNHETLMELSLRGYCGSPFYLRHDKRFIIKMLRKSDAKVLMDMLPNYQRHLEKYSNSLLAKYYGLHASRPGIGGEKVYFVVMENLLQTELQIHRQYDLKGSSQGRSPTKESALPRLTLKDPDFDLCFYLEPATRCILLEQIKIDCKFLEEQGIMGYSLLLGVHIESSSRATKDENNIQQSGKPELINQHSRDNSFQEQNGSDPSLAHKPPPRHSRDPTLSDFFTDSNRPNFRFGAKVRAHAKQIPQSTNNGSTVGRKTRPPKKHSVLLYLGIIDFLQNYNMMKRIEHAYKSLQYDAKEISTVKPELYANRFQEFLCKVFLTEDMTQESPRVSSEYSIVLS